MSTASNSLGPNGGKNPRRVAAGRRNRRLRKGLSDEGRERLRQSALAHAPWRHSTGPRSAEGKAQARRNGKRRQIGDISVRELSAELADVNDVIRTLAGIRDLLSPPAAGERTQTANE